MMKIRKKDGSIDSAVLTYYEVLINVILLGCLGQIIILFLPFSILPVAMGWWIGIGGAIFMVTHLYRNLCDVVMMNEKDANIVLRNNMLIRYFVIFLLMVIIYLTKYANPVSYVTGVIMLKPAVYMQPLIDKIYTSIINKLGNGEIK